MSMSMGQSIQTVFRKYADFTGRASRPEFWWWILFTVLVSAALSSFPFAVFPFPVPTVSFPPFGFGGDGFFSGSWLSALWGIAVLVPTLAVAVRRLRDAGFDWAHILWLLLPFFGTIVLIILCAQPTKEPVDAAVPAGQRQDDAGPAPGPAASS